MDWDKVFDPDVIPWVIGFFVVLILTVLFRKQIGGLIDRLTGVSVSTPGGFGGSLEASREPPLTQDRVEEEIRKPETPAQIELFKVSTSSALPDLYRNFIGRTEELKEVLTALRDPGKKAVSLTGLGGIGKTALARESADRSLEDEDFECVVWTSAKTEELREEKIEEISSVSFDLDDLLAHIARQCGSEEILRGTLAERRAGIAYLLASRKILVVVDNLETVQEPESLIDELVSMLGKSKGLLTSRHRYDRPGIHTIALEGLSKEEGRSFLKEEAIEQRNVPEVARAPDPTLDEIHKVTGGAPLAMKLVVGQMTSLPMQLVLKALQDAAFEGPNYEFYFFVYRRSWDLLELNAKKALVSMSVFPSTTGGAVDDVLNVTQLDPDVFGQAMKQLVEFSLVDKKGLIGQERYAMHPVTQYFVLANIVKKWSL
jgi:LuxR family glucitol operon transcriptional activator